jgi:protein SCO1/2
MPGKLTETEQKNKWLLPSLLLVLIAVVIFFGMKYFEKNLYTVMKVPEFALTDQNNKQLTNHDLLGKVYLVEFFFSKCPTICPVMNRNMMHIQQEIKNPEFQIVSISIDPENDTPENLKKHAKNIGADQYRWHFLTGNRDYIGRIADQFDIYVGDNEDESENLNHSGMIALVDKEGNIRCRFDKNNVPVLYYSGLNYEDPQGKVAKLTGKYHPDREALIEDIKKLLK